MVPESPAPADPRAPVAVAVAVDAALPVPGDGRPDGPPAIEAARRIEELPREVGLMLLSVGAVGFVLPAMAGAPAILAGGLVLWPRTFGKMERWLQRRCPVLHREGMRQVVRYLDDLERRFPDATRS